MRIVAFVAFVSIPTLALGPMPAWLINLLGLVCRRLASGSSWLSTIAFCILVRIKHLLVVTVLAIFALSTCFLDEMEMAWDLLLGSRAGTSTVRSILSFPLTFSFPFRMLFRLR